MGLILNKYGFMKSINKSMISKGLMGFFLPFYEIKI